MDNTSLIQLITGQSPAMALAIILLILYNRQNADMLRREKEFAETLLEERRAERILATEMRAQQMGLIRDIISTLAELKNEISTFKTEIRAEMHALRNKVHDLIFVEEAKRQRRGGSDSGTS